MIYTDLNIETQDMAAPFYQLWVFYIESVQMLCIWPEILLKVKKTKIFLCEKWKYTWDKTTEGMTLVPNDGFHHSSPLFSLLIVHGGWICGSGRAADPPRVWRAKAKDGRDSRWDGRPWALPHHLLHLPRRAAQNTGDLMSSTLLNSVSDSVSSLHISLTCFPWC